MGGLKIGSGQRGQQALIVTGSGLATKAKAIKIVLEIGGAVVVLEEPSLPRRGQIQRFDERHEQPDIAHPDLGTAKTVVRSRLKSQHQHFGVGCGRVAPSERFDA